MPKRTYETSVSRTGDGDLLALRFTVSANSEEQARRLARRSAEVISDESRRVHYQPCPPAEPRRRRG
jgi:hypothetical protein